MRGDRPFPSLTSDPNYRRRRSHNLKANLKFWLLHKARHFNANLKLWFMTWSDPRVVCITQEWPENSWRLPLPWASNSATWPLRADSGGTVEDKNEVVFCWHSMYCLFNIVFAWEWCLSICQNHTMATGLSARCYWVLFQIRFHYNNALSIFYFFQGALSDHSN